MAPCTDFIVLLAVTTLTGSPMMALVLRDILPTPLQTGPYGHQMERNTSLIITSITTWRTISTSTTTVGIPRQSRVESERPMDLQCTPFPTLGQTLPTTTSDS